MHKTRRISILFALFITLTIAQEAQSTNRKLWWKRRQPKEEKKVEKPKVEQPTPSSTITLGGILNN